MEKSADGEKRHKKSQRLILEMSTILFFFAKNASLPLSQQCVYHFVTLKYNVSQDVIDFTSRELNSWLEYGVNKSVIEDGKHNFTKYFQGKMITTPQLLKTYERIKFVNEESSVMVLLLTVAELLPTAVVVILFGVYSDFSKKRKFLMHLPCLGTSLYSLGFILTLKLGGSIDNTSTRVFIVLASIISGLSGSFSGYLCGNSSYISDTDTFERRTSRLALVELFIGVTFGLTSLMNGLFIAKFENFDQLFWIVFFVSLMAFLLIIFFLDEPENFPMKHRHLSVRDNLKMNFLPTDLFNLKPSVRKKIWLTFGGYIIFVFVQQGQERTFVPFLKGPPLLWDSTRIGIFFCIVYIFAGLGAWPGVILLRKCCGDVVICLISMFSKILGSVFLALSTNAGEAYGAGLIQLFHLAPYAVARSIISKEISPFNQGSIYAFIHSSQAIVGFIGPFSHNALHALTMNIMGGLVFIISACFLVVSIITLSWTYFLDLKVTDDYVDIESKEESNPSSARSVSESTAFANLSPTE